jgi:acetylornithine/N-succinyldiaminopimelate aminotransferase
VEKRAAAKEVRGRGFIQGIQLDIPARPIVDAALEHGVLFNSTQDTVVRFLPPFLLEEKHVDKGIRLLKKLLGKKKQSVSALQTQGGQPQSMVLTRSAESAAPPQGENGEPKLPK